MRWMAGIVALVAAASICAQMVVSNRLMAGAGPLAVGWRMLGYFTILSNVATLVLMARACMTGAIGASLAGAMTVTMVMVGLGYHTLLAGIWAPVGLAWWADQGLHSVVPLLVLLWWFSLAPKAGLTGRHALLWLLWPAAYTAYALLRGWASGFYPYPFLDATMLAPLQIAINITGLCAAFVMLSLVLIGCARILR